MDKDMGKIFENIDSGIKSGQEKARLNAAKEKMQIEALESMNTGRRGFFWDKVESEVIKGQVDGIRPRGFEDGLHDWFNFSFTDPRTIDGL